MDGKGHCRLWPNLGHMSPPIVGSQIGQVGARVDATGVCRSTRARFDVPMTVRIWPLRGKVPLAPLNRHKADEPEYIVVQMRQTFFDIDIWVGYHKFIVHLKIQDYRNLKCDKRIIKRKNS